MIVSVLLRKSGEEYGGKPYHYETDLHVKVGDVVICPTGTGINYGKITRIDVPQEEIDPRWRYSLREIVDKAEGC